MTIIFISSCKSGSNDMQGDSRFTMMEPEFTKISFVNSLTYTEELNTYTYRNFYNGAGVGIGDINNDGLQDVYFCANQTGNRLYLNKGNFTFEDITESSGVSCGGSWSTGVTICDINGDGFQDIYVCKSGDPGSPHRKNELFLNNGDLTFSEKSREYGLDFFGLSNHASFFDYDRDGDLDCYLLNNSFQSVTGYDMIPGQREKPDSLGANKLLRNDKGYFTDVTAEAGIFSSKIGFGLGVSPADVNRDGWTDIYVSNDFFERDYLYINNCDGTFTESLTGQMTETGAGSMGADIADINNDGWPEIFTTEMTPEDNARYKTKAMFDSWDIYQLKLSNGYHHQFARNVLQVNNRNGTFSETGRYAGVNATDWSWGALIMDLDNDGWNDIFVANGIFKDLLDRDFLDIYSNPALMRTMIKTEESAILRLIEMIPSVPVPNYVFHNNGDYTFTNLAADWGLGEPSFSNGAAYADLDNDGDLDLVINNVNMAPFIYRNDAGKNDLTNFLTINLVGNGQNRDAIGSRVTLFHEGRICYRELVAARGFQSSVDKRLHFGLGKYSRIDSVRIEWPDGFVSLLRNIAANRFFTVNRDSIDVIPLLSSNKQERHIFEELTIPGGTDYRHSENNFSDFERERLLFGMISNEGPRLATGDVNNDGMLDIYLCGAKDSPGSLLVQNTDGSFHKTNQKLFEADKISEDTDCVFFDADSDGDQDLYVTSGGNEFPSTSSALIDRLYINNGKGIFSRSDQMLPVSAYINSSCVKACDFDSDGDSDLFVGSRMLPFAYGLPANGYLLENNGKGIFSDVSSSKAAGLINIGMITDMEWADIDNDKDMDIVITGDWMPVKIFVNDKGSFTDISGQAGLKDTEGWWNSVEKVDINKDGLIDFILGNHGENSSFKANPDQPVVMYVNDFDLNGSVEQIICLYSSGRLYPLVLKDDLIKQVPSLDKSFSSFDEYKDKTMEDIFPEEILNRSVRLEAKYMKTSILLNKGNNNFTMLPLPAEAQFFPVYTTTSCDFNNDGLADIVLGGNQYRAKPQTGIYAAGYGLVLKGTGGGNMKVLPADSSGLLIKGEVRDLKQIMIRNKRVLVVSRNNDKLQFYKF